jgi:hypothetical protein
MATGSYSKISLNKINYLRRKVGTYGKDEKDRFSGDDKDQKGGDARGRGGSFKDAYSQVGVRGTAQFFSCRIAYVDSKIPASVYGARRAPRIPKGDQAV